MQALAACSGPGEAGVETERAAAAVLRVLADDPARSAP